MNHLLDLRRQFRAGELTKQDFIERMHSWHHVLSEFSELLTGGDISRIELNAGSIVYFSREGLAFECDPEDRRAAPVEALNFGQYEAQDAGAFWSLLEPGQTVIDVGAHIGWYALHVAAKYPTSRVEAIEPVVTSYRLLEKNRGRNAIENCHTHHIALADREDSMTMFVDPNWPTASSFKNLTGTGQAVAVVATRLDHFCSTQRLAPDVIKIDVEGAELSVLRGAATTLDQHRPAIFCEMLRKWTAAHGYHPNDTLAFMKQRGYQCVFRSENGLRALPEMTDAMAETNFVFFHSERHHDWLQEVRS